MAANGLAPTHDLPAGHAVLSCSRCGGVWLPTTTRRAMIAAAVRGAEPAGTAGGVFRRQLPAGALAAKVVYRRCPECGGAMARRNFGGCSGVVIDECAHGSFFDAGELADVLEFVRTGGLGLAKAREEMERAREVRAASQGGGALGIDEGGGDVSNAFLRWALRLLGSVG
jgi:Zn-finger nucleic acid-binding protein